MRFSPSQVFHGPIAIIAPHMDDGVLACGGMIAQLPQKEQIHVIYATDGMRSPAPVLFWRDSSSPDLGAIRMKEAIAAMGSLGIPHENIHFVGLPEAQLGKHLKELSRSLLQLIGQLEPAYVLLPFRYDRHPDHLAVNHVLVAALHDGLLRAQLIEYFVYYRWRLLPARDVRRYIHPRALIEIDIKDTSPQKHAALLLFKSQTTRFYPWQTRPILTSLLLEDVCQNPELFLRYDPAVAGASVFSRAAFWIRIAHYVEPILQRWKYRIVTFWQREIRRNGN